MTRILTDIYILHSKMYETNHFKYWYTFKYMQIIYWMRCTLRLCNGAHGVHMGYGRCGAGVYRDMVGMVLGHASLD